MDKKEIVLFTDGNVALEVPITPKQDTVWLNRNQMAELFERDVKKYINNALKEELQDQSATVANFATVGFGEFSNSSLSALAIYLPMVLTSRSNRRDI